MIRAVVFDLDGVLRRFDLAPVAGIERRHELPEGSIQKAAFSPELLDPVITGRTSRADWVRAVGIRTAILTNGTDTIPAELHESGIDEHVDAVFNSAEIGIAKPDPRAFQHVLNALALTAEAVFFTDDSAPKLADAEVLGIRTHHFTGVDGLRAALCATGVSVSS